MTQTATEAVTERLSDRIGVASEPGQWFTVTQEAVDTFASLTNDQQWIHVDVERAKSGPFGGTVAHGFLTLSLVISLLESVPSDDPLHGVPVRMGVNYGLNRVRFPSPVLVGSRIRARRKLVGVDMVAPDCVQQVTEVTVEIDGQAKPACVAELVVRIWIEGTEAADA